MPEVMGAPGLRADEVCGPEYPRTAMLIKNTDFSVSIE
jgi:hypothetical protein